MTTIWLVTARNGGHEAGWPVRVFATEFQAKAWAKAEQARVDVIRKSGGYPPDSWVDGDHLGIEEVPVGCVLHEEEKADAAG